MSKKRASKSKRRRDSQRPASGGKEPRLVLVKNTPDDDTSSVVRALPRVETAREPEIEGNVEEPKAPVEARAVTSVKAAKDKDAAPTTKRTPDTREAADDLDEEERFFHEGRIQTPHAFAISEELEVEPPKPSPKMTPAARARRAHFSKYVKGAMVAATAILALAGIRLATGRSDHNPDVYRASVSLEAPRPAAAAQLIEKEKVAEPAAEKIAAPIPTDIPPPEPVKAVEPEAPAPVAEKVADKAADKTDKVEAKAAEPIKAAEPAKTDPAKTEPAAAAPAPAPGTKTALEEKNESRKMLERGKSGAAIEAGERAVALDPADGEAWLILGAAYQEKGNVAKARSAFQSCLKEAKRGPKSECKAMLQ